MLDKHTNLATALLGAIKARGLDGLYNTEEEALSGKGDQAAVVRLIQGPKGTAADKLRLALVQILAAEAAPSEADVRELSDALAVGAGRRGAAGGRALRALCGWQRVRLAARWIRCWRALTGLLRAFAPPAQAAGADMTALSYVARLRRNRLVGGRTGAGAQGGAPASSGLGGAAGGSNVSGAWGRPFASGSHGFVVWWGADRLAGVVH